MALALRLAARGRGRVEPNPMVGCVLARNGRIIGQGYHRRFGGLHAETDALHNAQSSPKGCDVFVTLEPCSHQGKTPPCTSALIQARVRRVFAAMTDPAAHVRGRGFRQLRNAGIQVRIGLLEPQARRLNAPYLKLVRERRPWVILKWAQSIDGKLATRTRRPARVSTDASHRLMHRWRAQADAILIGVGTALADDPILTARVTRPNRTAARIVLDANLRLPAHSRLVRSAQQTPLLIFCDEKTLRRHPRKAAQLTRRGCQVLAAPANKGLLRLHAVLDELGRRKMTNLLVEGGGLVLGSFVDQNLADEARIFVSPTLVGGSDAPSALDGAGPLAWPPNFAPDRIATRKVGTDLLYLAQLRTEPR